MISIRRVRASECFKIAVFALVLTAAAPAAIEQYKKENRDYVTEITKGKPEIALGYSKDYLSQYPEDLEALYIQAAAYCQMNEIDKAVISTKKALELGLPFERFLAGPRNLFKPLYASKEFKKLAKQRKIRLVHGPVVGAVTATTARFWLRTASEASVRIIVRDEKGLMDKAVSNAATARQGNDYTCVVEVTGLRPSTRYFYEVEIDGTKIALDPRPSFRTFPDTARPAKFTIGFGGGAGYTPWFERMWLTILKRSPIAFLFLGDNVYIDTPEVPETQRYCYYRRQSRPEYRQLAAVTPIYAIWDDHDFGTNDCSSSQSLDDPPWKMDVLKVFEENFVNPFYGAPEKNPGCWFDFSIGDVHFIMLDCRFYRQYPREIENPSMLGPFQKQWLFDKLKNSKGTFKVIASSVPWAPGAKPGSKDPWDGFPAEREEIFSFVKENRIEGVILLSADRHRSDAWKIKRENSYPLYEMTSSKLTNVHTHKIIPQTLFGYNKKCSFGLLSFDTTLRNPELTYQIVNIDDELIYTLTIKRSQLVFPAKKKEPR